MTVQTTVLYSLRFEKYQWYCSPSTPYFEVVAESQFGTTSKLVDKTYNLVQLIPVESKEGKVVGLKGKHLKDKIGFFLGDDQNTIEDVFRFAGESNVAAILLAKMPRYLPDFPVFELSRGNLYRLSSGWKLSIKLLKHSSRDTRNKSKSDDAFRVMATNNDTSVTGKKSTPASEIVLRERYVKDATFGSTNGNFVIANNDPQCGKTQALIHSDQMVEGRIETSEGSEQVNNQANAGSNEDMDVGIPPIDSSAKAADSEKAAELNSWSFPFQLQLPQVPDFHFPWSWSPFAEALRFKEGWSESKDYESYRAQSTKVRELSECGISEKELDGMVGDIVIF